MMRFSSLADGNRHHSHLCVISKDCFSFSWFFPQPVSSCVCDNQYSAEHLTGSLYTSPEFSLCSSLLSRTLSQAQPKISLQAESGYGLPCLFPIPQGSLFFIAYVQWMPWVPFSYILSIFLVVLGRRVNLGPVTPSWSEIEVAVNLYSQVALS